MGLPQSSRSWCSRRCYFLRSCCCSCLLGLPDLRGLHVVLHSLRAQFDWILIDGPGFDTTADAMAITMTTDGVIMMIESERDSFRLVSKALSHVQGRRMLGAVMF